MSRKGTGDPMFEDVFLAVARTGAEVIVYAFAARKHTTLTLKEQFEDIVLNLEWEPFDSVEIVTIPSDPRKGPKTVFRGRV